LKNRFAPKSTYKNNQCTILTPKNRKFAPLKIVSIEDYLQENSLNYRILFSKKEKLKEII